MLQQSPGPKKMTEKPPFRDSRPGAATPRGGMELMGARILPGWLDAAAQRELVAAVERIAAQAPWFHPVTPWGKPMRVRMTSAGAVGWVSDRRGYRYEPRHPSGVPWPPIPEPVLALWRELVSEERLPDCCLVNFYGEGARMGLHQDRDEGDFRWPVLSVSLGDEALFRIGGTERRAPTRSVWLRSGDVVLLEGPARLAHHGIDRIRFGSSGLLPGGGRLNLTLRAVAPEIVAQARQRVSEQQPE